MKKRTDGRFSKKVLVGHKDGKPKYKYIYAKSKKELDKKYLDFMKLYDKGILLKKDMTMNDLFEEWLVNYKVPKVKPQTVRTTRLIVGKMMRNHLGHIHVRELNEYHIEQYRDAMISEGYESTYNRNLVHLRSMLWYAIKRDIIIKNVADGLPYIKLPKKKKRALTPEEVHTILNADLNPCYKTFVSLLYYTGMRKGEALALECGDIDFVNNVIKVRKTVNSMDIVQNETKTPAGMRDIPMPSELVRVLAPWVNLIEDGYLFTAGEGHIRKATFDRWWTNIKNTIFGDSCPSDFTPHIFRHNYASDLYKANIDIKTAQYLLGHESIETTLNIYTHFADNAVAIDKLDDLYKKNGCQTGVILSM